MTVLGVLAVAAAVAPLLARWWGRDAGWPLAAVFLVLAVVIAAQLPAVLDGEVVETSWPWIPAAGVNFALWLDGVGWLFAMLVLGVGALIMAYCARYFGRTSSQSRFYLLMGIFAVAMLGLVLADDLLLLFVFWELTSICSFFLIGGTSLKADKPAMRALLVTAGGGLALLSAVTLLAVRTGTTQLSAILADTSWLQDGWTGPLVAVFIIIAAFTKSAQVPFHFWLPGAMAASTPVSAYLHAAAMVKAGIYLLIRFTPAFSDLALWNVVLVTFGLATAIYGAVLALKEYDLKSLAAFSTVSQLGYLVAIIGIGTSYALAAAAIHTLAHALFKATLFMMVGVIDHQAHTRDIRELGGLRRSMPVSAVLTGLGAMSLAGLPPVLGFYSKEKLFAGFLEAGGPGWVAPLAGGAAVLAAILTFGYAARFWYYTFGGQPSDRSDVREAPASFLFPPAVTALAGLGLGLSVPALRPFAERVVADTGFGAQTVEIHLIPGLTPDVGMSALAILFGLGLFLSRERVDSLLHRRSAPTTGDAVFDRVHATSLAFGRRVGDLTRSAAPPVHIVPAVFVLGVLAAVAVWWGMPVVQPPEPVVRTWDWLVIAAITAAVLGTVLVRNRIAAVVLLGVVGVLLGVWFVLLGAIDVALTQITVEVLTVVVLVLVLRRLPVMFQRVGGVRIGLSAALALAAGGVAAVATFLLTGRRELSPVSEYLMTHSEEDTGGINVVNTILVDYRPLDTLGEVTVVGIAGVGILALLHTVRLRGREDPTPSHRRWSPIEDPWGNAIVIQVVGRVLAPVIIVLSLWMLLRGHNANGGGFIGALVAGAGLCLAHAAAPDPRRSLVLRIPGVAVITAGLALSVVTGLFGLLDGSFLRPLHADIGAYHFTSALVFDVGIYLAVIGTVVVALTRLGVPHPPTEPTREPPARSGTRGERDAQALPPTALDGHDPGNGERAPVRRGDSATEPGGEQ
ncbi:DUF4040 family protein [Lipingzhangella sp. LS1_29]|uniref:DUF4040 family protein n=1 Tax=Lipingzhangella rawalii TaxID=2055835 RepID=A0ABU2H5L8_9ACTN|nr:DUF4040 family protein [Lipingzhangella rawalii]MDS1269914.1 DUF4040 family protein [Lipingzhangella rawalii]